MDGGKRILLGHGSGGRLSAELMRAVILPRLSNPELDELGDSAIVRAAGARLAFTTDSYVVDPIFFPGGDIGELAVNGTVNDLAVSGADPLFLSLGMVIEEGLPVSDLERVLDSARRSADATGVKIVAGDTKVVPRGKADKLFLNTSGIGVVPDGVTLGQGNIRPGDAVLVSGTVGDHGVAVLSQRAGVGFATAVKSDTRPLHRVAAALRGLGAGLRFMRDPTRGGLAATLNESCNGRGFGIEISEAAVPVSDGVRAACELLGLDVLHVANEGKLAAFVAPERSEEALGIMRAVPESSGAAEIGRVTDGRPGMVVAVTRSGGRRIVDLPAGEILPRIC
jgi:hydrogenase expression/formation protein HypE